MWICPECNGSLWKWRSGDDDRFCQRCGAGMQWTDGFPKYAIWCANCEMHYTPADLKRWTGDDAVHYLCPGCDSDLLLLPVERLE